MEQTFPKQKYTSIETSELERLRAQVHRVPMAPHTFAQMVNRVRDLAFDFGTTEQFRDRVSELLGEYIDTDAKAPAVVVPEPTHDEFMALAESSRIHGDLLDFMAGAAAYGLWLRGKIRVIPADRLLGDGAVQALDPVRDCQQIPAEVATIGDEYKFLHELESYLQGWREFHDADSANLAQGLVAQRKADCSKRLRAALRANQEDFHSDPGASPNG